MSQPEEATHSPGAPPPAGMTEEDPPQAKLAQLPVVEDTANPVTLQKEAKKEPTTTTEIKMDKSSGVVKKGRGGSHGPSTFARILSGQEEVLRRMDALEHGFKRGRTNPELPSPALASEKKVRVAQPKTPEPQEEEEEEEEEEVEVEDDDELTASPVSSRDPLPRFSAAVMRKLPRW